MSNETLSASQANLKLAIWNAEAGTARSADIYEWLQEIGLPEEVVLRLHDLVGHTVRIGKKVVSIGKVLLIKIIEFVKAHPFLVAGAGIAAVVGSAIYSLIISIPFVGPILEPIARALGIGLTLTGAVLGHVLDKQFKNVGQNIVEVASEFFQLLTTVLNAVACEVVA